MNLSVSAKGRNIYLINPYSDQNQPGDIGEILQV